MAPYLFYAIRKATTTYNPDGTENTNLMANTMAHAVAGAVYGMKGTGSTEQNAGSIKNVNPGYPEPGRTHNCVSCLIATDATLAGNPASALPINSTKGVPLSVLSNNTEQNLNMSLHLTVLCSKSQTLVLVREELFLVLIALVSQSMYLML